jgi:hypothetical protein
METTKSLRDAAREAIQDAVTEAARQSHQRNYHRLHIWRDGTITWDEFLDQSSDTIDCEADQFAPVPTITMQGTGGFRCNCDYCESAKRGEYQSQEKAIDDAIADSDLSDLETGMLKALDAIPAGYFADETFGEFMNGFAKATGMAAAEADEQWAGFSRQLSGSEQMQIESKGYQAGLDMGKEFRKLYPQQTTTRAFQPTHVITLDSGEQIEVELVDGAAYTRAEWESTTAADYECSDGGEWTFQGDPFAGTVRRLQGASF